MVVLTKRVKFALYKASFGKLFHWPKLSIKNNSVINDLKAPMSLTPMAIFVQYVGFISTRAR